MRSKLPNTGTTIFSVMSLLAAEHHAVNLGQGFPGFPIDSKLIDLVSKYMYRGFNQYAPMPGVPALRELLSAKMKKSYGTSYNPNTEITITAGATQAIFTAITAFIHPGDEVIVFAPAYDCYAPAVEICGGKVIWVEMDYPDYSVNWEVVKEKINSRTRMIVINTPQNPAAAIWSKEDMHALQALVSDTDIIVLSDEVYEHIVFDGLNHQSCALFEDLAARSLIVYSFGKTLHATGWKMGYVVGPAHLMSEFRKVHQYNVFSCSTPVQHAIAEYMTDEEVYNGLSLFFQGKRDLFLAAVQGAPFEKKPSAGSYFQLMKYNNWQNHNDVDLAKKWTIDLGITCIPLSVFYPSDKNEGIFRFCFAKEDDILFEAAQRLKQIDKTHAK